MYACQVRDFGQWRNAARPLIASRVPPSDVVWSDWRSPSVFASAASASAAAVKTQSAAGPSQPAISRELLDLLESLALYRNAGRWELMYRLVWRVLNENRSLLENDADRDVRVAREWAKAVHRDVHKMHAFVRFHETDTTDGGKRYIAWFEPEHEILRHVAPFFEQRFPNMRWMIATPDGAAIWDGTHTEFANSPRHSELPRDDSTHGLWRAYYRNICNVARINPKVMQREMPKRYWRNLPEATEIDVLILEGRSAHDKHLSDRPRQEDLRVPVAVSRGLQQIVLPASSLQACRRCELWRHATQAVAGEGPENAAVMLVGEQPGDEEDLRGRVFVGPAGRLLDDALREAGIDRREIFITNAVKHFKWEPRGKHRLHKRPHQQEVRACAGWLEHEIAAVAPRVIVALGATAIRAVTGVAMTVEDARASTLQHAGGAAVIATYHPSAVLRADEDRRPLLFRLLCDELRQAIATAREA
jgi:uracil-DNA glycosylase